MEYFTAGPLEAGTLGWRRPSVSLLRRELSKAMPSTTDHGESFGGLEDRCKC